MAIKIATLILTALACCIYLCRFESKTWDHFTLKSAHYLSILNVCLSLVSYFLFRHIFYLVLSIILLCGLWASIRFQHYLCEILIAPLAFFLCLLDFLFPETLQVFSNYFLPAILLIAICRNIFIKHWLYKKHRVPILLWGQLWSPKTFPFRMSRPMIRQRKFMILD